MNAESTGTFSGIIIRLKRKEYFLQPVEILGSRADKQAPFTKTEVSKKDIAVLNLGQDLPYLLNQTPSVVVNSDAGNGVGYTGIRIRGSDLSRINVTLNGIPYNDAESQGVFFVDLPDFASSVNSIQIQRGVGTSSNGAGAFGATINISSNEFIEKAYAELNNSIGSFNTYKHTIKAGSGLIGNHFTLDARLSNLSSGGYIDRATSDMNSFYLTGAYTNKKTQVRLNVFGGKEKTYQAWYGVPESLLETNRTFNSAGTEKPGGPYENETDNFNQTHYQFFVNHSIRSLVFNVGLFLTRGKGYYEQYKAGAQYSDYGLEEPVINGDTISTTDLIRQLWLDNNFYGSIFSLQYSKHGSRITFGGGWNQYNGNHFGKLIWAENGGIPNNHRWYDLDALKTDFNIYGKIQQQLTGNLELFGDLQYRKVNYQLNGFRNNPSLVVENEYDFLNPKIGLNYRNQNWRYYISYAVASKEPNRDDFETGLGQQPNKETLHDFEAGIERKTGNISWSANAFLMKYRDQLVLTGQINDVGAYTRTNIPRSYRTGIEFQSVYKPAAKFRWETNLSLSKNKVIDFTEYLDDYDNGGQKVNSYSQSDISFSPEIVGGSILYFLPRTNLEISIASKYVGKQFLDNTGNKDRLLDDYFTNDLRVQWNIKCKFFKEIILNVHINNVFNVKYEPNGYSFSYLYGGKLITENFFYPMAGTNFMMGLNLKF